MQPDPQGKGGEQAMIPRLSSVGQLLVGHPALQNAKVSLAEQVLAPRNMEMASKILLDT